MNRYDHDQSEWLTRKRLIDPKLKDWGWAVVPFGSPDSAGRRGCYAITEYPTANGPADYALVSDGKVLGIVEAKKLTLGPQGVLTQAERYARGGGWRVRLRWPPRPFLYSTNGEVIWFHDVRHPLNRSRKISAFHTPAALQEMLGRDFDAALCCTRRQHPMTSAAAAVPDRGQRGRRAGHRGPEAPHARGHGDRHRQDLHDGQPDLPADEVRRRPADPLPGGPPCAGRPGRAGLRRLRAGAGPEVRPRSTRSTASGFRRRTSTRTRSSTPRCLPNVVPDRPEARPCLRLRLHHPAHGHQPLRPAGRHSARATRRSTTTPSSSTSPSTPST